MKKLRPIVKIHGGKYYLCDHIIKLFPSNYEQMTYIETYGGAASVLLNKKRSIKEIYNDICEPLVNIFRVMINEPERLVNFIRKIEYSEVSFEDAKKVAYRAGFDSAVAEIVIRRMSRGGMKKNFSWSNRKRGGRFGDLNAWETFKNLLPLICDRVKGVEFFSEKALSLINEYSDDNNCLFYLDPPYVLAARTAKKIYDYEMTDEEHVLMAETVKKVAGKVLVSGYNCPLYENIFKDWRKVTKDMPNNSGQGLKKERRLEVVWLNY